MSNSIYKAYAEGFAFRNPEAYKTTEEAVAFALGQLDRQQDNPVMRSGEAVVQMVANNCGTTLSVVSIGNIAKPMNVLVSRGTVTQGAGVAEEDSTFVRVSLVGPPSVVEKIAQIVTNYGELGL